MSDDGSQAIPDIVPPYLRRRIAAAKRYPGAKHGKPDTNRPQREAFIAGAEWEAEQCRTPSRP